MIKAVYPYLNNFLLTLSNIYHFVVFLGKHALHKNSKLLVMIVYPAEVPTNGIYRRCPSVALCMYRYVFPSISWIQGPFASAT